MCRTCAAYAATPQHKKIDDMTTRMPPPEFTSQRTRQHQHLRHQAGKNIRQKPSQQHISPETCTTVSDFAKGTKGFADNSAASTINSPCSVVVGPNSVGTQISDVTTGNAMR